MSNDDEVRPSDLLRLGHYNNYIAAVNALKKVRVEFGIRAYGKVFWWQYVTVYNNGVSLKKLIEIYNKNNGDWQWRLIKEELLKNK